MVNVALVGVGNHSIENHAPALRRYAREHPETVRLAAVCDLDEAKAEKARDDYGFARSYTSVEAMLGAETIEAAVAVVPIAAILDVARPFLARRIPVVVEKPPGQSLAEARELAEAAAGAEVMVSLNRRFDPAVARARRWLEGRGPMRALHGSMVRHRRTEEAFLWGTAVHLLDLMCFMAGPLRLRGTAARVPSQGGSSRVALLVGEGGVAASVHVLPCGGRREERLRIVGDGWCVDVWTGYMHPWRVEVWEGDRPVLSEMAKADEPMFVRNGSWNETVAFLGAVVAGAPLPGPSVEDALPGMELAAALAEVE